MKGSSCHRRAVAPGMPCCASRLLLPLPPGRQEQVAKRTSPILDSPGRCHAAFLQTSAGCFMIRLPGPSLPRGGAPAPWAAGDAPASKWT